MPQGAKEYRDVALVANSFEVDHLRIRGNSFQGFFAFAAVKILRLSGNFEHPAVHCFSYARVFLS